MREAPGAAAAFPVRVRERRGRATAERTREDCLHPLTWQVTAGDLFPLAGVMRLCFEAILGHAERECRLKPKVGCGWRPASCGITAAQAGTANIWKMPLDNARLPERAVGER